jgi:HNH endonuclease
MKKMTGVSLFAGRGPGGKTAPSLSSLIDATGVCWEWNGRVENNGYGRFQIGNVKFLAHRAVYEILVGDIPQNMVLDHLCKNRRCVNPDHLSVTTQEENNRRSGSITSKNIVKTSCPSGHPYDKTNTKVWVRPNGRKMRYCAQCRRDQYYKHKTVHKEVVPNV